MRLGIDARFYGHLGKGLGRYTEKLIAHLESIPAASEHIFFIFLRRENFEEYQPKRKNFVKVLADYPWYGWQEQILFPRRIAEYHLDLMHFPHFNVPLLLTTPFVVTIHDLILLHYPTVKATELPPFLYWIKYIAYRIVIVHAVWRSRAIIAVSQFTKADLEAVYPSAKGKVTVTLEATDDFCFWLDPKSERKLLESLGLRLSGQAGKEDTDKPFVLYVGNAYPHKNLGLFIEIARKFPQYDFLLVGKEDFFYRAFKRDVAAAGCANIRFAGYLDDRSLGALYRRANVYLFPSFYEGFGLPGLEAMTYGAPVVAAEAGSLREVYGAAAYYFDPRSPESCAVSLRRALSEDEGASGSRQARFRRAAQFSWQAMAEATFKLYEKARSRRY